MFERLVNEILGRGRRFSSAREAALWHYENAELARGIAKMDDVEEHYRRAIEFDPQAVTLQYNLGLLLQQLGDMDGAETYFKRALELQPDYQVVQSSFLCLGDFSTTLGREQIYHRHLEWARTFADSLSSGAQRHNIPTESDRLRVGYVSADFRSHVIGRFIEPVLRHHDKTRFDVVCYSNSIDPSDEMTRHLQSLAGQWRDVSVLTDEELARVVRNDRIDILIDLSGHSLGNRLLTFARKPAPVQMTWLGYLNTTGMGAMDYRLTDGVSDPPGTECWYREQLLRLPHTQWCYAPEAGPVTAYPQLPTRRMDEAPVMFACLTRFMKINHDAVSLWARILREVPGAKLRIIDVPNHARGTEMRQFFKEIGMAERVEFFSTLRANEYWKVLDETDIALDTFPYTGATTSCDCLWMGVPVVTLAGVCGAARSASSLLNSLGLSELSAKSEQEYVAIAAALGRDRSRLEGLRKGLRQRMLDSPICNPKIFTTHLEQQLETAWRLWRGRAVSSE